MAGGNNKSFMRNPEVFIRTHQLMIGPQGIGAQALPPGRVDIDLVSIDPQNPGFIRLENYIMRRHDRGAQPVRAFFLPAIFNNTSLLDIDNARRYMFTADLSGCLFAAYGANANAITVEHVNVRSPAAAVSILQRAQAIIGAHYNFYKILSPTPIPEADPAHVKVYVANSTIVGVNTGAAWQFYYKPTMTAVALL